MPEKEFQTVKDVVSCLYHGSDVEVTNDGDTIIYNEREKDRPDGIYTIKQKVTPKQGRAVLFDGWLMHTAEQPINNVRCIVNYNLD